MKGVTRAGMAGAAVMALLVIGGILIVARGAPPAWDTANGIVDAWLEGVAEPSGDRGWSRLAAETQSRIYGGDANEYWNDLDAVDWSEVAWAPANGHVDDGAFYLGDVWLRSHPSTLPRFLLERGLATASCVDEAPLGISLQMRVGWFTTPRISAPIETADGPSRCAMAFAEHPGPPHEPFDIVTGAWASPGSIQRVGVFDATGLVASAGWGRENPPLEGSISVSTFEPGDVAVTWKGGACDANTTLSVTGTPSALRIQVRRGTHDGCAGTDVVYETILELRSTIPIERVHAELIEPDA